MAESRGRARSRLRQALASFDPELRVLAEDVLGLERSLELVAADATRRLVVVLVAEPGRELEAIADALAQCTFLAPRLKDWRKLAPDLPLDPERGARALVVAPEFCARARAAAQALGAGRLELVRSRPASPGGIGELELRPVADDPVETGVAPAPQRGGGLVERESAFRTGLADSDLGLGPDERASLRAG